MLFHTAAVNVMVKVVVWFQYPLLTARAQKPKSHNAPHHCWLRQTINMTLELNAEKVVRV